MSVLHTILKCFICLEAHSLCSDRRYSEFHLNFVIIISHVGRSIHVCVLCIQWLACRGQGKAGAGAAFLTMWILRVRLGSSGVVVGAFTSWALSLAPRILALLWERDRVGCL